MHLRIALLPSFVCLIGLTMPAVGGPPRSDHYGDPLPPGVLARLGTERLTLANARFLAFSPDGQRLAAYDSAADLRVWDVATGKVLFCLTMPSFASFRFGNKPLAFSPDSKTITLACLDERNRGGNRRGTVRIWEVATGKELHNFCGLQGDGFNLVFSPDGRYLFAGGYQAPLLRWDLTDGGAPKEYGKFYSVAFLAISREGKTLTAEPWDQANGKKRTIVRWDAATGEEIGRRTFTIAGQWLGELSLEGGLLAAPDADGKSIALLDPLTGRELARAHGSDYPFFIPMSAGGTAMTCTSKDGTVRVWDTATGKMRARFKALSTEIDCIAPCLPTASASR